MQVFCKRTVTVNYKIKNVFFLVLELFNFLFYSLKLFSGLSLNIKIVLNKYLISLCKSTFNAITTVDLVRGDLKYKKIKFQMLLMLYSLLNPRFQREIQGLFTVVFVVSNPDLNLQEFCDTKKKFAFHFTRFI